MRSLLVEIEPMFVETDISNVSGFGSSGRIRAIEAEQLLRAAQVGGLPDARLALNVYDLFVQSGRAPGPWIGEEIEIREPSAIEGTTKLDVLSKRPHRRAFESSAPETSTGFLSLKSGSFSEIDSRGRVVEERTLEYVVPEKRSTNTIACALLARVGTEVFLGVDDDDLPAAQCFVGNSELLVAPAWRIPKHVSTMLAARAWVRAALEREYALVLGETWELGGSYFSSAGMSPEVVFPLAIEVKRQGNGRALHWIPLREIGANLDALADGHLRIVALRAAHALGVL